MALVEFIIPGQKGWFRIDRLERQLKDYVAGSLKLIWQRQAIFLAAISLTAVYFDASTTFACYALILFTEIVDLVLDRKILRWTDRNPRTALRYMYLLTANTVASAFGICLWVVLVAMQQGPGGHFMPLFFLFAASLFAAMNNHQLLPALIIRLAMYFTTFLFVAVYDLWIVNPPLSSELWLNFFTIVFVLYFIIDSSLVYLRLYRSNLRQLEDLQTEHERTKVAYEAKSQFLSTVSHELRTPLTSIKGSLDLVSSGALGPMPEQMEQVIGIAGKNSGRLANLINDILDLQKFEAGEMAFRFAPVDTAQLVTDAVDANRGYATTLGITMQTHLPAGTAFINGDESRLMQVMANLLSNAVKFSNDGGTVRVTVELTGDKVRILVEDDGAGIPAGSRDKVFGQFTQVDSSDRRKVGGTGLGMNITKRIVERHNGRIDYQSTPGEGTTFFMEYDRIDKRDD